MSSALLPATVGLAVPRPTRPSALSVLMEGLSTFLLGKSASLAQLAARLAPQLDLTSVLLAQTTSTTALPTLAQLAQQARSELLQPRLQRSSNNQASAKLQPATTQTAQITPATALAP